MTRRAFSKAFGVPGCLLSSACGYRVGTRSDLLPDTIQTIAVRSFENLTNRYKLSERLPAAISREFITRTRYRITGDEADADAVLNGAVTNYTSFPIVSDVSGRAAIVQVIVNLTLTLTERKTGKVLFTRPGLEYKQRYEMSVDPNVYFEESDMAMERLSREVGRMVVSAVVEAF